jgi:hypothetical protein
LSFGEIAPVRPDERKSPFREAKVVAENVSMETYLRQEVPRGHPEYIMSRSDLMLCYHCPEKWLAGAPDDSTKSTKWGTLLDLMLLTPDKIDKEVAVCPATYKGKARGAKKGDPLIDKPWNSNQNDCDEWEAAREAEGKTCYKADVYASAEKALARIQANPEFVQFVKSSRKQVMVIGTYEDRDHGVSFPVKSCLDLVPDVNHPEYGRSLADLKTCVNADPDAWKKAVFNYEYDIQAAMHLDLYTTATKEDRSEFRHLLIENTEPFQPALRMLSSDYLNMGRIAIASALSRYARCLKTGNFPDFEHMNYDPICGGWRLTEPETWMIEQRYKF